MSAPGVYTLITGASSGLGRAAAVRLARDRALILHGRNLERLEETRALCADPGRHLVWPFELAQVESLAASLGPLLAPAGRAVEAFVHCAGMVTILPMKAVDHHVARQIMDVNYFSAVELVNLLLKKKANQGRLANIVFISSIFSTHGARGHAAYCASKAALDGLMRALAVELAPAVRVNSILPGAIKTRLADAAMADPAIAEKFRQDYPLGLGDPAAVAEAIEFVLSDRARWLTGQQLVIDGGRTINMSLK